MIHLRHFFNTFRIEVKRLFAYRAQFWFEVVLSSFVELGIALVLWSAVFSANGSGEIRGYTFQEMVYYVVLATFLGQAVKGTGIGTLGREVYDGSFTRYLVYPLSVYSYKFGIFFARSAVACFQLLLVLLGGLLLGYFSFSDLSLISVALAFVTVVLASFLYFLLIMTAESVSFWADQAWAVSAMLQFSLIFLSGKLIPVDLFPGWLQTSLAFSPFPLIVFFPVQTFLGMVSFQEWLWHFTLLCFWVAFMFLLCRVVIGQGLKNYTGVGI
ncbi:MAG: hypothetical protein KDD55_11895 [Bdellovibrionales bacterium]|nr:hypothetical protein [Bdellovibrionales bacterium]